MTDNRGLYFTEDALRAVDNYLSDQRAMIVRSLAQGSDGLVDREKVETYLVKQKPAHRVGNLNSDVHDSFELRLPRPEPKARGLWYWYRKVLFSPSFLLTIGTLATIFGAGALVVILVPGSITPSVPNFQRPVVLAFGLTYLVLGLVFFGSGIVRKRLSDRNREKWTQSGALIDSWLSIEGALRGLGGRYDLQGSADLPIGSLLRRLSKSDALPDALDLEISEILHVRNRVAHGDPVTTAELISVNRAAEVVRNRVANVVVVGGRGA